jgi:OmpA-OmpF porin, OOP family
VYRTGMALGGAFVLMASGAAVADSGTVYISGALGLAAASDINADSNTFLAPIDVETGTAGQIAIGRHFGEMFRGEIELTHTKHDADQIVGTPAAGDVGTLALGGNFLADLDLPSDLTPYIGLGVGMVRVSLDGVAPVGGSTLDDNATVPYVQGIVGASYELNDRVTLFGDLRFRGTQRLDLTTRAGATVSPNHSDQRLMIGLRWRLGGPRAAVKAPPAVLTQAEAPKETAPAPAEKPAPTARPSAPKPVATETEEQRLAELPREYLVFFDWDRADITTEAEQIIRAAAANAKELKSVRLTTTGHADRSGPDPYNLRLSQRRAAAVRAVLIREGVPTSEIEIFARGESEPLVQTPDGVREPRNRRVQIFLN